MDESPTHSFIDEATIFPSNCNKITGKQKQKENKIITLDNKFG